MLNHQTHYGGATSLYPDQISADFITDLREAVEKDLDCLFAYQYGASGNLNFISNIEGERKYATYLLAIPALTEDVKEAVTAEKLKLDAGQYVTATINLDKNEYKKTKIK